MKTVLFIEAKKIIVNAIQLNECSIYRHHYTKTGSVVKKKPLFHQFMHTDIQNCILHVSFFFFGCDRFHHKAININYMPKT